MFPPRRRGGDAFVTVLRELQIRFSFGFDLTEPVRDSILAMAQSAWVPATTQAGEQREGAAVCELTNLDLSSWLLVPAPSAGANVPPSRR